MFKELFKEDSKVARVKGKEILVNIRIEIFNEEEAPDFDYGNEEENKAEMDRFESGELRNIGVIVHASYEGLSATDSLGQCFVSAKNFEEDITCIVEDHGMIDFAIDSLCEQLTRLVETLWLTFPPND